MSVHPADIYMVYFFSRNSENIQVVDIALIMLHVITACVVYEVDVV